MIRNAKWALLLGAVFTISGCISDFRGWPLICPTHEEQLVEHPSASTEGASGPSTEATADQRDESNGSATGGDTSPAPTPLCHGQGFEETSRSTSSFEVSQTSAFKRTLTTFCFGPVPGDPARLTGVAHRSYAYGSQSRAPAGGPLCVRTLEGGPVADDAEITGTVEIVAGGWVVHLTTATGSYERVERERCTILPAGFVTENVYRNWPGSLELRFDVTLALTVDCRYEQREDFRLPDFISGSSFHRIVVEPQPNGAADPCVPPFAPPCGWPAIPSGPARSGRSPRPRPFPRVTWPKSFRPSVGPGSSGPRPAPGAASFSAGRRPPSRSRT